VRAQEEERARIAHDLHDEVNQALTAILLRLQAAGLDAPAGLAEELRARVAGVLGKPFELGRLASAVAGLTLR